MFNLFKKTKMSVLITIAIGIVTSVCMLVLCININAQAALFTIKTVFVATARKATVPLI